MPDNPPPELLALIARFEANRDAYRAGAYNETMVRREFIDPFLKLLGWDVDNTKGYAEAYKEVVHEDAVRVGGSTKAPDYSLRIGGQRKLFVEAKKPAVNIKDDVAPAYQVRRYAWSAKLPLSVLTDFEEFAVYDCTNRPDQKDDASHSRIMYLRYEQYPKQWGDLLDLFSPDAIMRGSFDKFAQSSKRKRGTAEVDDVFLQEISLWRDELARNIALRNPGVTTRQLNYAVQATIDRLIFLRIAEDRGIEGYGRLRDAAQGKGVYAELGRRFQLADAKYNSGLFHFKTEKGRSETPDTFTLNLIIDDKVLKGIIRRLYYPDSPYQFDVIPADILGQVYEQFLGKVIRLTAGGQAKVEEKPEVKKAGGVFYTPTYIVDYIVAQTVGKLLAERKPGPKGDASKLRILDPACGSGSFLLGAYQYLLDWHVDQYRAEADKWARGKDPTIYQNERGEWKLTITERKRILLNNIYGVDIDPQAVEVTKLSLLLKVMEGETEASLGTQLRLLPERVLPDLSANIKCGNSLIGPDFYDGQMSLGILDEEEMYRVNAFDWVAAFPTIVPWGGFDAVIGNPPYIRIQAMKEFAPKEVEFYKKAYKSASKGNYDIYVVFAEKGLQLLNRNGLLGFILPHKFFNAQYGEPLRKLIADGSNLTKVVHFGSEQIFTNASTYTCLLFLTHHSNQAFEFSKVDSVRGWLDSGILEIGEIHNSEVTASEWNFAIGDEARLFKKLQSAPLILGKVAQKMYQGPITSADTVFLFKEFQNGPTTELVNVKSKQLDEWVIIERTILKEVVRSGQIFRYQAKPTAMVLFPYEVIDNQARIYSIAELQTRFPEAWKYLLKNKTLLEQREKGKFKDEHWYRFGRTQNLGMWEQPKVMVPYMIKELSAYYDVSNRYYFINVTTGGYGIVSNHPSGNLSYLTGLLNSRLLNFYLKQVSTDFRGGYFAANKQYIEQLPIREIDFSNANDVRSHSEIVQSVVNMQDLHKRLAAASTTHEKTILQRQISATDHQIDQIVYQLYGLTDEEIAIVEGRE